MTGLTGCGNRAAAPAGNGGASPPGGPALGGPAPRVQPTVRNLNEIAAQPKPQLPARPTKDIVNIHLYFIQDGDQGKNGKAVGCGDSVVPIDVSMERSPNMLQDTYALVAKFNRPSVNGGLYKNYLTKSTLKLEKASIQDGKATIELSGKLDVGGECDAPRIAAQLTEPARQFPEVKEVAVTVNGKPLEELLSLK